MNDQQLTDLRMFLIRAASRMQFRDPEDVAHDVLLSAIRLGWGLDNHTQGFWRTAVRWAVLDQVKKRHPIVIIADQQLEDVFSEPPYEPTAEELVRSLRKIAPDEISWLENYYSTREHVPAERVKAYRVRESVKKKLRESKQVWC